MMEPEAKGNLPSSRKNGLSRTVRTWEVWKLLFVYFLDLAGTATYFTYFPITVTDFFASEAANEDVHCADMEKDGMSDVCRHAHTKAIFVTAGQTLISNGIVAAFMTPLLGAMSDVYGRKPFILLEMIAFLIPKLFLFAHVQFCFSLYWYFGVKVLCSAGKADGAVLAFITDSVAPEEKNLYFTFLFASVSLGALVRASLTISGLVGTMKSAVGFSVAVNLAAIIWVTLLMSESQKPNARASPASKTSVKGAFSLLTQNRLSVSLTVCIMAVGFGLLDDTGQVIAQYLLEVSHFTSQDLAITMIMLALSVLLCPALVYVLDTVLKFRHTSVLMICFAGLTVKFCMLAFAGVRLLAFFSIPLTTLAVVVLTTVSTVMSDIVPEHQQGALQGSIVAVRSVVSGVGPLVFLAIYMPFRTDSFYFPGAAMLVIACTQLFGLFFVNRIRLFLNQGSMGNDIEMCSVVQYKAVSTQEPAQP